MNLLIFITIYYVICLDKIHSKIESNTKIYLDNNRKLQNILIYIDDNVPEENGELLESIKKQISSASYYLFQATSNMKKDLPGVQFGNVSIRMPLSWTMKGEKLTWQQCGFSDIRIVTKPSNGNSDSPFTKQLGKCGKPGEFSRFTNSFLLKGFNSESVTLQNAREIMREFTIFRYGVFKEKILNNRLHTFNGSNFIKSACDVNVQWSTDADQTKCTEPNHDPICSYKLIKNSKNTYSVLFDSINPSSIYFCNDDDLPHNKFGFTLHNKNCKKKSISSVILKHADFNNINNFKNQYQPPTFSIVKGELRKIILILDISGSMTDVMKKMKEAVQTYVVKTVEDSAEVGIVTFNDEGQIVSNLTKMNTRTNREMLKEKIGKLVCFGGTNIASGLIEGIKVLGGNISTNDPLYGTIILLSDGDHNAEDEEINYKDIIKSVIRKGIVTNIISYNQSDELLIKLSKETKGTFNHATYNTSIQKLFETFVIQKPCDLSSQVEKKVVEGKRSIKISKKGKFVFGYIDKFVGNNPVINLDFKRNMENYRIELLTESGKTSFEGEVKKNIVIFRLSGKIDPGKYSIKYTPISKYRYKRSIYSSQYPYSIHSDNGNIINNNYILSPIGEISINQLENVTSKSYIILTIDLSTLEIKQLNKVKVILKIVTPTKQIINRIMMDDGMGDDLIGGDNIFTIKLYSRDLCEIGIYNFYGILTINNYLNMNKIKRKIQFENLLVKKVHKSAYFDKIPPSKIENIEIKVVNKYKKLIKVKFIASGDDSLEGKISKYQILIRSTKDHIINIRKLAEPREHVTIVLNIKEIQFTRPNQIAIRGIDDYNNVGEWSEMTFVKSY